MGYSIIIGGEHEAPLATLSGIGNLRAAVAEGDYEALSHFVNEGWSQNLVAMAEDAERLASEVDDEDIKTICEHIIEAIDTGEGESAVLFDGLTANEVEDDWEFGEEDD